MKTLLLMRHAKSSWKKKGRRDHDRPLSGRGKREAPRMGGFLLDQGFTPEVVLSSTARRARKTASKVAKAAGCLAEIRLVDGLYPGDSDAFWHALAGIDESAATALVVGHNPALEQFLAALCGQAETLPTCAVACLKLRLARWADLSPHTEVELLALWRVQALPGKKRPERAAKSQSAS